MREDSDFSKLPHRNKGITFDPTINAGHILTFLGFMLAGFGAYSTLDNRVTIVEQRTQASEQRYAEQDQRLKESLTDIKTDLRDLKRSMQDLARHKGEK